MQVSSYPHNICSYLFCDGRKCNAKIKNNHNTGMCSIHQKQKKKEKCSVENCTKNTQSKHKLCTYHYPFRHIIYEERIEQIKQGNIKFLENISKKYGCLEDPIDMLIFDTSNEKKAQ